MNVSLQHISSEVMNLKVNSVKGLAKHGYYDTLGQIHSTSMENICL